MKRLLHFRWVLVCTPHMRAAGQVPPVTSAAQPGRAVPETTPCSGAETALPGVPGGVA